MKFLLELAIAFALGYLVAMGRVAWDEYGYAAARREETARRNAELEKLSERIKAEGLAAANAAARSAGSRIVVPVTIGR